MSNQEIKCGVGSCRFNRNHMCSLNAIEVAPSPQGSGGTPEDESYCGSYNKK